MVNYQVSYSVVERGSVHLNEALTGKCSQHLDERVIIFTTPSAPLSPGHKTSLDLTKPPA